MEKGKNLHSGGKGPENNSWSDLQNYFIESRLAEMYLLKGLGLLVTVGFEPATSTLSR